MKRDKRRPPAAEPVEHRQPLPAELCEHIGFMLGKARQELADKLDRLTAPLTIRHLGVLMLIQRRGALRQTDLADMLRLDRTTMMKLVDELEAAGYVKRGEDPEDRRANAVKATARGQQWLDRLRPTGEDIERRFLAPLSPQEQDTLRTLLTRLVSHSGSVA